jgi:hypothetical protein
MHRCASSRDRHGTGCVLEIIERGTSVPLRALDTPEPDRGAQRGHRRASRIRLGTRCRRVRQRAVAPWIRRTERITERGFLRLGIDRNRTHIARALHRSPAWIGCGDSDGCGGVCPGSCPAGSFCGPSLECTPLPRDCVTSADCVCGYPCVAGVCVAGCDPGLSPCSCGCCRAGELCLDGACVPQPG